MTTDKMNEHIDTVIDEINLRIAILHCYELKGTAIQYGALIKGLQRQKELLEKIENDLKRHNIFIQ